MKTSQNVLSALLLISLCQSSLYNFNIGYDGNDPYVSYETSWGKERFIKEDYIRYFPYYRKYVEMIPFVSIKNIDLSKLPAPYNQLTILLPFNAFGMYFNADYIKKFFEYNQIKNVVEIGSYFGLSTRHIAQKLPQDGKLYAVDSWAYFEGMYEQFLSNIILKGLTDKVVPIRLASQDAVSVLSEHANTFDLIYIDGDHETAAVMSDLELYYPLLSDHGIICGDDWLLKTVRYAVVLFAQKYDLTIYADCNFWFLKSEGAFHYKSFLESSTDCWKFQG